jgi:hypothetical protein
LLSGKGRESSFSRQRREEFLSGRREEFLSGRGERVVSLGRGERSFFPAGERGVFL